MGPKLSAGIVKFLGSMSHFKNLDELQIFAGIFLTMRPLGPHCLSEIGI